MKTQRTVPTLHVPLDRGETDHEPKESIQQTLKPYIYPAAHRRERGRTLPDRLVVPVAGIMPVLLLLSLVTIIKGLSGRLFLMLCSIEAGPDEPLVSFFPVKYSTDRGLTTSRIACSGPFT